MLAALILNLMKLLQLLHPLRTLQHIQLLHINTKGSNHQSV